MAEYVSVPASRFWMDSEIVDLTMETLVEQGKLPADFDFRALAIRDRDERQRITLQDIGAALGRGAPSGHSYLTEDLPACVSVPEGGTKSVTAILRGIDTDYHQLGTMLHIAGDLRVKDYYAYQAWAGYIKYLDPPRFARLQAIKEAGPQRGSFSKLYNFQSALLDVVIRDSALLPIHENPKLVPGHTRIKQGLLALLLRDNHPEIEYTPIDE